MFQLEKNEVTLYDAKIEVKAHDDENERALDIDFVIEGSNDLLAFLDKNLKSAFYRKENPQESEQMEMIDDPNYFPVYKFPEIKKPIAWSYQGEGYTLDLMSGLDTNTSLIYFEDVSVKNIKFLCKDGGTVKLAFRCRVEPSEAEVGKIYSMVKQSFPISLLPPTAEKDLVDDAETVAEDLPDEIDSPVPNNVTPLDIPDYSDDGDVGPDPSQGYFE